MANTSDLSRRRFLKTGALVAGAAAALTPAASWAARPAVPRPRRQTSAPDLKGRWIWEGEEGYAMAAWPNNARWAYVRPLAIAMCLNDQDVHKSIAWARGNGYGFAIRSGGHSYAGFSTTNGVLIDVKPMNRVTVDWNANTVVVQGGANNQDVAKRPALQTARRTFRPVSHRRNERPRARWRLGVRGNAFRADVRQPDRHRNRAGEWKDDHG
jgi:hypothetical protein